MSTEYTSHQIKLIRKYLKIKICEDNVTFRNHQRERSHVYDIIKRTISQGESHSALILGPRGCGKTTMVNSVLQQISKEEDLEEDAIIVKLNGLVHHDDKLALRAITAQMQLENAVGDRVFGTFAENLSFLLSCISTGADKKCKSMVFLLEEFDIFCRDNQTLLYNLFDITHSKSAPMCVLGITNRLDVMELLEKRVKSRFSHRHIFVFPNEDTEAVNFQNSSPVDNFSSLLEELLCMPVRKNFGTPKKKGRARKKSLATEELMDVDSDQKYAIPEEILKKCKVDPTEPLALNNSFLEDWNAHIQSLARNDKVIDSLEKFCYYTVNEQVFRNVLFQLVLKLSPKKPYIEAADLTTLIDRSVSPEHRVMMLQSLSILELSLVIAMKHGMEIFDGQPMNFEMVLHRYTKFANTNSSTQSVPRPVVLKAWEHLQALEIVVPVRSTDSIYSATESTVSRVQKEYQLYKLSVPVEDVQLAVNTARHLPTEIAHWCNNSVF